MTLSALPQAVLLEPRPPLWVSDFAARLRTRLQARGGAGHAAVRRALRGLEDPQRRGVLPVETLAAWLGHLYFAITPAELQALQALLPARGGGLDFEGFIRYIAN